MFKVHRMKVCLDVTECNMSDAQMSGHHHPVPTNIPWPRRWPWGPSTITRSETVGIPGSRDHQPGLLMIYSLHLPQAMRGTTLNEQHKPHSLMSNFSIAYFWDVMIYDLSLVASLPRCCLIRCHPSPDDTGWQLDMITNNLPEQSGLAWPRASHEISENQFLICCLLGSDNTVISENKS